MDLLFVGTGSVAPEPDRDTACLLVNGRHLIDTGWCAAQKMGQYGISTTAVESLILTHYHHDHYLGLPQLLFSRSIQGWRSPLQIVGPAGRLEWLVETTLAFLQVERYPEVGIPLEIQSVTPGEQISMGELEIATLAAPHSSGEGQPEEAMSLRLTERSSRRVLVYSGDTSYNPALAEFARGAHVLVHDAAHTSGENAAITARDAGVERLYLVHHKETAGRQVLASASALFGSSRLAYDGQRIEV